MSITCINIPALANKISFIGACIYIFFYFVIPPKGYIVTLIILYLKKYLQVHVLTHEITQ